MPVSRIAGLLVAGMVTLPAAAWAQSTEVAYGAAPRAEFVVFLDSDARLSPVAGDTVSMAADAARSARRIQVVGRHDHAAVVKRRLVQDGVPEAAVVVLPRAAAPLGPPIAGIEDPAARRVEITF